MALLDVLSLKEPKNGYSWRKTAASVSGEAAGDKAEPEPETTEVGWGNNSVAWKKEKDGTVVTLKHEESWNLYRKQTAVWVIPCYLTADLKAAFEGELTVAEKSEAKLQVKGAGVLEGGPGVTSDKGTAGIYGSAALSVSHGILATYSRAGGVAVDAFVANVYGTGNMGAKIEVHHGPKVGKEITLANWHLFVIHVGRYAKGKFESFRVEPGKDLQRLLNAFANAGSEIEQAVDKYAPEAVKTAAVDAAKWTAESPAAAKIEKGTGKVLDTVKDGTGVDIGGGIESVVRDLVDPTGQTSNEATKQHNLENKTQNAKTEEFDAAIAASGLNGELRPFRTGEEYNAILTAWQAESVPSEFSGKRQKWQGMIDKLVSQARAKKAQHEADAAAKKAAAEAARKQQAEREAAELAALVKTAVAEMEAARKGAQGSGNDLNNGEKKTPNPKARKYFESGWRMWDAGEGARKQAAALQGMDQVHKAKEATAQYVKAKTVFTAGLAQMH
jgi:hypothetical protein